MSAQIDPVNHTWPIGYRVYLYTDADGHALYVGQTSDVSERHRTHGRLAHWFERAERFEVLSYHPRRRAAIRAERRAIRRLLPAHNIHHNPARKVGAVA